MLKYLIVGYMFLFIYRPFEIYQILSEIHLERIWMLLTIAVFLTSKKLQQPIYGAFGFLQFAVVILLSGLFAFNTSDWNLAFSNYLKIIVFFIILSKTVNDQESFLFIIKAYIVIMIIYEAKSLIDYQFFDRKQYRMGIYRMIGVDASSDPNAFAASINYSIPFAIALLKTYYEDIKKRIILYGYFILSCLCVILTGSRSGFICMCVNIVFYFVFFKLGFKKLIVVSIISLIVLSTIPIEKSERLSTIFNPEINKSATESMESRFDGLIDGFKMLMKRPLLGYGAGTFTNARVDVESRFPGANAHNIYGQVMGELGILGVISFLVFLRTSLGLNLEVIRSANEELSGYSVAILLSMIMLLFNGYGSHSLYRYNWLWYAAFTSIIHGLYLMKCRTEKYFGVAAS